MRQIMESYFYEDKISKLPEIEDYHYKYFEKLWDLFGNSPEPQVKNYAMAEIWSWKGTLKVFDMLYKWFNIRVNDLDQLNKVYSNGRLDVSLDINYTGNQPDLLIKLITDYFNFMLFFTQFKLVFRDLNHTLLVDYATKVNLGVTGFVSYAPKTLLEEWKERYSLK